MEKKIERLLGILLLGKCPNENRALLDKFLVCLSKKEETETECRFSSVFSNWLRNAITMWTTTGVTLQNPVVLFTVTLTGLLSKQEGIFSELNSNDFFKRLIDIVKQSEETPEISLAYIDLLSSLLDHRSGLAWTRANYFWDDIFQMSLWNENKEISVKSTKFVSKLLERTAGYDEIFASNIVKRILVPLSEKMLMSLSDVKTVSLDATMTHYLRPTLKLIGNVLDYFLEGLLIGEKDHKVLFLFVKNFCLEERLSSFMRVARLKSVIFDLGKVIFIVEFLELYVKVLAKKLTPMEISSSVGAITGDFLLSISKGDYEDALEFCNFGHLYWSLMDAKIPTVKAPRARDSFSFSNQLVIIELMPIRFLTLTHFSAREKVLEVLREDLREHSLFNFTKMLNEGVMRAIYYWRKNLLLRMDDLFKLSSRALSYLKSSRRFFEKHTAVVVFQTLFYCLQDFLLIINESPGKLAILKEEMSFLAQVFEMVVLLIEEFQINWCDSIEATEVISISLDFLTIPGWSKEVVLQALKLIRIAIANCTADNMALLVDKTTDSSLDLLGTFLYAKARDDVWEVRKEIFEIVFTMAEISSERNCRFSSVFLNWLRNAITMWTTTGVTLQNSVVSFTVTLTGLLSKQEGIFTELNSNDFFKKLIDIVKHSEETPQISLAYIDLLSSLLDHRCGLAWTRANYFWDDIFQMSLSNQNKEINFKSTRFISKLLEKTVSYDKIFANNIVKRILVPLSEKMLMSLSDVKTVSLDATMTHYLRPTLKLIGNVLDYFLEGLLIGEKDHKVLFLFVKNFCLEERLSSFMRVARLKSVIFDLGKVIFIIEFLELYVKVLAKKLTPMEISSSVGAIREDFLLSISKGDYEDALEFCNFGHLYWSLMNAKIPSIKAPRARDSFSFSNQLVVIELTSIRYLTLTHFSSPGKVAQVLRDDSRDSSSFNLTKLLNEGIMRAVYYWRKNLPSRKDDLFKLSSRAVSSLKTSKRFFEKHTAVVVFQTLFYCLQDFLLIIDECPRNLAVLKNEMSFLSQVFEMVVLLIEEFQINWCDSIEATEVISISFDFLSIPGWSKEVVLPGLKLIRIAIANCTADNMALLVDKTADSSLDLLGTFLYAKAGDDVWEVRKEIFEIVFTMAEMSSEGKMGVFVEWIKQTVTTWCKTGLTPQNNVLCFVLRLASLLSKNEDRFKDLSSGSFFIKLVTISKIRSPKLASNVMLAYVKLLLTFLEHKSGVERMIFCNLWDDILHLGLSSRDQKEIVKLVAKFLEKAIDCDIKYCNEIIKQLLLPLNKYFLEEVIPDEFNDPRLKFVENILIEILEGIAFDRKNFSVAFLFWNNFQPSDKKIFPNKFKKILFIMQFIDLRAKISTKVITDSKIDILLTTIKNNFLSNISKENFDDVIDFCTFGLLYWKLMDTEIPKNEEIPFSNQLVVMFLIPHYSLVLKNFLPFYELQKACLDDEFRDLFVDKIIGMHKNYISQRLHWVWRNRLTSDPEVFKICLHCTNSLKDVRKFFLRNQAVLIFQTGIYILKDIIISLKNTPQKMLLLQKESQFIFEIFDLLGILIEEFKITWKDSFEAVDVMDVSFHFLSLEGWPIDVVVKILDLINIATRKYMTSSLVLMIEDSTLATLGSFMFTKLHDEVSEVQQGALEVVRTMACMSRIKVESTLRILPFFEEWLKEAILTWSSTKVTPPLIVASFTLNLASFLSKKEERFCNLNTNNFYIKLINVLKTRQDDAAVSIKLGYIKLLSSFLEHKSGLEWMIACNFWRDIYKLALSTEEKVARESTKFMSKILENTIDHDETFCDEIIKKIMTPLGENVYKQIKTGDVYVDDELALESLKPTLKLMGDILEYLMGKIYLRKKDFGVALLFLKNFHQEERISDFMIIAQSKSLVFDLGKIMFIMQFLELYVKMITKSTTVAQIDATIDRIKRNFISNMYKGEFKDFINFCKFGVLYWRLIKSTFSTPKSKTVPDFSLDMLFMLQIPNWHIFVKYCMTVAEYEEEYADDDIRDLYFDKVMKMMTQDIIRVYYYWRDRLGPSPDLFKLSELGGQYIQELVPYLDRTQAVTMFQDWVYCIKDVFFHVKETPQKLDIYLNEFNYFGQAFEILTLYIEKFQITWKDCFEAIELIDIALQFLSMTIPEWPSELIVQILKLVNVAIVKYMSPNLALLVENPTDSIMDLLGRLMSAKLHCGVLEVRKNSLEVVCTMTSLSTNKVESTLKILQFFEEWLKEAILTWNSTKVTPPTTIAAFSLNLASLLSKKEERFTSLNTNNFFFKLINVTKARQSVDSVQLGYIKLLSSLLEHKSGLEWMIPCNFWEDIYKLTSTQDVEIVEKSTKFMSKILEKTINYDEGFCDSVVKKIMMPLGDNVYKQIKTSVDVYLSDDLALECLKPTLRLMGDILDYFLKGIYLRKKNFGVVFLFLKNFHLEERLSDFMIIAQSQGLVFDLGKIMFVVQFLELYVKSLTGGISEECINSTLDRIRNNFISVINKDDFESVLDFSKFGVLYWNLINWKFPAYKPQDRTDTALQLLCINVVPNWRIVMDYCLTRDQYDQKDFDDDIRNIYMNKAWKMVSPDLLRIYYRWMNQPNSFQMARKALTSMIELLPFIKRDQAVIMFLENTYHFKDMVDTMKENSAKMEIFSKQSNYFARVFEFFGHLIETFQISWKDSVEAIEFMDLTFDFLALGEWSSEVIVQILRVVKIAIVKYMSPNLALLVENPSDSLMDVLGKLIAAKLVSGVVEVRGGALEVACTMTSLLARKFPSLQKVLMDSELPTLVVKMSTCDGESFVRATAIKCLQEMIQVEEIWNNALKTEDLPQKMRDILLNEAEGIVRVEAATFMCVAYEHQQFAKENLDGIYETMIYSSTTDLHWEVKVRALNFWDKVIKNHLQNQGMIDDSFPNVTFSKEHRKIVTLTDSEIRKRLLKVLSQLSSIGCLGVLMTAIKDDCDMEVSKTAVKITQRLIDLFKKYNVRSDSSTPNSPALTENGMSAAVSLSSGISVDESMDSPASSSNHPEMNEEIIDQIVNSKDVSLLKSVYTPSDYGSVSNYDIQVRKVVTPNEFLQFCQQDLNSLIAEKKNWLNGIEDLGSLLDDMLKTYEDDVNNMDCY